MQFERAKNAQRNITFGVVRKLANLLLAFAYRTCIIYYLGELYVGLNNLFVSILAVLSLLELGFGSAMVYNMYSPIAEDDEHEICALLRLYRNVYRIIGSGIAVVGLATTPFVPYLVKDEVPKEINIYVIYLLTLMGVVASYFAGAYRNSIFTAYQRNDVSSKINTVIDIVKYGLQILAVIIFGNYYFCLVIIIIMTLAGNLCAVVLSKKMYPALLPKGELDDRTKKEVFTKVKSVFLYKVGNVVSNSADNIVISAILGVMLLAKYSNYYYVISMLFGILEMYYQSITAGIGNKAASESKEDVYKLFKRLNFIQFWGIGWMSICLLCLYQDFILLWVGERFLFDFGMVVLMVIYFYSWKVNDIIYITKAAIGLWEYDKWRPLLGSMANLVINMVLCHFIGIYGVVISTIVCELTFSLIWSGKVLFRHFFKEKYTEYLKQLLRGTFVNLMIGMFTFTVVQLVEFDAPLLRFLCKSVICLILPNMIYVVVYRKNECFEWLMNKLLRRVRE